MQEKKYNFIYKTTNILNNKYYIGMHSTNNLDDGYLGSGLVLQHSLKKYGIDNHIREILEFALTREELVQKEINIVTPELILKKEVLNLRKGGKGGFLNAAQQRRRSIAGGNATAKKRKNDKVFSDRMKLISSENMKKAHKEGKIKHDTFTGKTHSEETKIKMSIVKKGKGLKENNSQFGSRWINNGIEKKKLKQNEPVPNGWKLGRIVQNIAS